MASKLPYNSSRASASNRAAIFSAEILALRFNTPSSASRPRMVSANQATAVVVVFGASAAVAAVPIIRCAEE